MASIENKFNYTRNILIYQQIHYTDFIKLEELQ